jgi:imidazolonepropionase-like amidohydrolase
MGHRIFLIVMMLMSVGVCAQDQLLKNATLVSGAKGQGVIRDVHIVAGRIAAIGEDLKVDRGTDVLDLAGALVTPGFIDSATTIGLAEVSGLGISQDAEVSDVNLAAGFQVALALNDASLLIPVASNDGITRGVIVPQPGDSNFAGQSALVRFQREGTFAVTGALAQHVYLRERDRRYGGGSRASVLASVLHALEESARFDQRREDYDRRKVRAFDLPAADLIALSAVRQGKVPLVAHVDRAADIEQLIQAMAAYPKIRLVLAGAAEAWKVADKLAERDIPVLINVMDNLPGSFDRLGARLDQAALLDAAGIRFAFMSESPFTEFRSLSQAAGVAVAYGLPWDKALAAITRWPAEIWGLEGLGAIAVGSIADLVVWSGDPLEVVSTPTAVMIDGTWISLSTRQRLLAERYRDLLKLK